MIMSVQTRQPQRPHVASNINGVKVTAMNDNKMWVGRSVTRTPPSNDCLECRKASPRRQRNIESFSRPPLQASWWNEKEIKRKRRVAKYRLYEAEGMLKSSLKKSFRSFKVTCMKMVTNF